MKKLSVFIEGNEKTLTLDKSIVIPENSTLLVKNVSVFWNYKNVLKGYNDVIQYNSRKHTIEEGYWTFEALSKKFLEDSEIGITLTKNSHNSTCTIETLRPIKLFKFGELLGFETNTTMGKSTKTSPNKVNINRDLKFVEIHCDTLVDSSINTEGKRSSVITTIPVTTESSLNDSVTRYVDVESRVPIRRGIYNNMSFHIETNVSDVRDIG